MLKYDKKTSKKGIKKQIGKSKKVNLKSNLLIFLLNINNLNTPIKRQKIVTGLKKVRLNYVSIYM